MNIFKWFLPIKKENSMNEEELKKQEEIEELKNKLVLEYYEKKAIEEADTPTEEDAKKIVEFIIKNPKYIVDCSIEDNYEIETLGTRIEARYKNYVFYFYNMCVIGQDFSIVPGSSGCWTKCTPCFLNVYINKEGPIKDYISYNDIKRLVNSYNSYIVCLNASKKAKLFKDISTHSK
jgi:hypothetical protein